MNTYHYWKYLPAPFKTRSFLGDHQFICEIRATEMKTAHEQFEKEMKISPSDKNIICTLICGT